MEYILHVPRINIYRFIYSWYSQTNLNEQPENFITFTPVHGIIIWQNSYTFHDNCFLDNVENNLLWIPSDIEVILSLVDSGLANNLFVDFVN